MSRLLLLLCIFAALSWSLVSAALVPPTGYSVAFTGVIRKGKQKYTCKDGSWIKTSSTAGFYTPAGAKLGPYWSVYDPKAKTITHFWNIINSKGGHFEAGSPISGLEASPVTTIKMVPTAVASFLALVKVHRGGGDADQVAFVSLTGTTGGLPPKKSLCKKDGHEVKVPFGGIFTFYSQDRVPPTVPAMLTPPGKFVQTLFLAGKRVYKFTDGQWKYAGFYASISEVAGGNVLGKVGTFKVDKFGSNLALRFKAPNACTLHGVMTKSARMYAGGCPWQLLKITAQAGYQSPIGKYTYALIAATIGGNPPVIPAKKEGKEFGSVFTGQCYLYT